MFHKNFVWNMAILEVDSNANPFDIANAKVIKVFNSRILRFSKNTIHTQADPFLFVNKEWLYLFAETQRVDRHGEIEAWRTRDLDNFEHLGVVLNLPHHVSFPLIFRSASGIHMLPETGNANEVAVYTFDDFPFRPRKEFILLKGKYFDPTIYQRNGIWWLFVNSEKGLELFYSASLAAKFQMHPIGVLSSNPSDYRSGGALIDWNGKLYRPAQNCTQSYGGNLGIMEIVNMSQNSYTEVCIKSDIFDTSVDWRSSGAHHLSLANFNGRNILAVDGRQSDYWINRPLSFATRMIL